MSITCIEKLWMRLRFRKLYSKFKYIPVSLCDIVKMAKTKDKEAVVEESAAAFSVEERRWTDAENTEEAVCLSGLSQPYGWEILSGTPSTSKQ